jgi:Uma2 family endonuclease
MVATPLPEIPETRQMTEAEYLAFEDEQDEKHEYAGGFVYAMVGAKLNHNIIAMNTGTQLNVQLAEKDCTVTSSDTRVHIARKQTYRYPDVTVFCSDPVYLEGRMDTILNPAVLVEVASPSTSLIDRNDKLTEYLQIESLQAYLLIAQNEPKVESFSRHDAGQWLYQCVTGLDASIEVASLGCTLALSRLYQKVRWESAENGE